ncbi:hypothetical protein EIP91_008078 [Steccherinum ochraceum]|uniref:MYND-type domain-containing protein n=1 Tax=Steccherinum ochraceum TaxID=92696 RepID=A0A4R0RQ75_9APHY|nr:hypothetical protein EIP91_008078 [Steccherinum ochraceum]
MYNASDIGTGKSLAEPAKAADLPPPWSSLALPSMADVRKDVVFFQKMRSLLWQEMFGKGNMIETLEEGMKIYNNLPFKTSSMENLPRFSQLVAIPDIPPDVVDFVAYGLQMTLQRLAEEDPSTDTLESLGLRSRTQWDRRTRDQLIAHTRMRLIRLCLREDLTRAADALPILQAMLDHAKATLPKFYRENWLDDPASMTVYMQYADALVFSNRFDAETKKVLDELLAATDRKANTSLVHRKCVPMVHTHLALVLQQMGVEPEQQKKSTKLAVEHLKNGGAAQQERIRPYLMRKSQPPHPVAVLFAYGDKAEEFLARSADARRKTSEASRGGQVCAKCLAKAPDVSLSMCSACHQTQYCSRACQEKDWKAHKKSCRRATA